jgi:hypothetical protein
MGGLRSFVRAFRSGGRSSSGLRAGVSERVCHSGFNVYAGRARSHYSTLLRLYIAHACGDGSHRVKAHTRKSSLLGWPAAMSRCISWSAAEFDGATISSRAEGFERSSCE